MKKILATLLVLLMLTGLCACGQSAPAVSPVPAVSPAPADNTVSAETPPPSAEAPVSEAPVTPDAAPTEQAPEPEVYEADRYGFRFVYPASFQNLKGELLWEAAPYTDDLVRFTLWYVPVPEEQKADYEALKAEPSGGGYMPPAVRAYNGLSLYELLACYCDDDAVRQAEEQYSQVRIPKSQQPFAFFSSGVYQDTLRLKNGWTLVALRSECFTSKGERLEDLAPSWVPDAFKDEVRALLADVPGFLSGIRESEQPFPGRLGYKIAFASFDLNGEAVGSKELFGAHTVTMINVWSVTCGPCRQELPKLEEMNRRIGEQGCQIIGVCIDADQDAGADIARTLLTEAGVSYPNLTPTGGLEWTQTVPYVPTTFFVDSEGVVLTAAVQGARFDSYAEMLRAALEAAG